MFKVKWKNDKEKNVAEFYQFYYMKRLNLFQIQLKRAHLYFYAFAMGV